AREEHIASDFFSVNRSRREYDGTQSKDLQRAHGVSLCLLRLYVYPPRCHESKAQKKKKKGKKPRAAPNLAIGEATHSRRPERWRGRVCDFQFWPIDFDFRMRCDSGQN